jgi:hypothetical protein
MTDRRSGDAMTESSDRQSSIPQSRRDVLRWISIASIALAIPAFAGCSGSIPPRMVKKLPSHISGMRGGGGRMPGNQTVRTRTST